MKLGLIGFPLGHSWSPEIHKLLINEDYSLWELKEDELPQFLEKRDFDGINVTIPYKKAVIPFLDEIDETAEKIGAVNCIVNRNGKLKGYNTDYYGLVKMLESHHIELKDKTVAILGTGGVSGACKQAVFTLGGKPVMVSCQSKEGSITYDELYDRQENIQVIINATPVGMYPNIDSSPIDIRKFENAEYVIDVVANPLKTSLMFDCKVNGIPALGGFEMLVWQAFAADELFLDRKLDDKTVPKCISALLKQRRNTVLIGMPSSGKSTISHILKEKYGYESVNFDEIIEEEEGRTIPEIFAQSGEAYFRNKEAEVCTRYVSGKGLIISPGGGIIKNETNMRNLSYNGNIILIRRDLDLLEYSADRPLAFSRKALEKIYEERKELYLRYPDYILENNAAIDEAVQSLLNILEGEQL